MVESHLPINDMDSKLSWRVHPAAEQPRRFYAALTVLFAAGLLTLLASGSLILALVLTLAVWASANEFFLPSDYLLTPDGVSVRRGGRRRHLRWTAVRRVVAERRGLLLLPSHRLNWWSERRGIYLRCTGNRAEVALRVEVLRRGAA